MCYSPSQPALYFSRNKTPLRRGFLFGEGRMPNKPPRPCHYPGCPALTNDRSGYCERHLKQTRSQYDRKRGNSTQRGYGTRWQHYRKFYLIEHPLCVLCAKTQLVVAATVVDHIKPHQGNSTLFWDPSNHQALCESCHNKKTAAEDGAFGNMGDRGDEISTALIS